MKKLLFTFAFYWLSQSAFTKDIPVEEFFKDANISSMSLSPSGSYLAISFEQEDEYRIATLDTKTFKPINSLKIHDGHQAYSIQWITDERFIYRVNEAYGSIIRRGPLGELFAVNFDGTKQSSLWYSEVVDLMPEDENLVLAIGYSSGYPEIYKLNIYSGSTFTVFSSPYRGRLLLDNNNIPRLGIDDNQNGKQEVYYRQSEDSEWFKIDTQYEAEPTISYLSFSKDNKSIYIYDETPGKEGVYLYEPETDEKQLLWKDKYVVTPSIILSNNFESPIPIGVELHDGKPTIEYFDSNDPYTQLLTGVQQAFPNDFIEPISSTKSGDLTLILVSSDKNPGEYYLLNHKSKQLTFLASKKPWLKPSEMNARKPITFKARDGLQLHGYLTVPEGKKKYLPMIVLVHGGPYGVRDYWWFDPEAQLFANRGYAVLQVNFRGSGGYGTEFEYGAYRQMGAEMQDDITDATLWAIEKGIADKERICIYGSSYGGYAAYMGVIKEPELYQCAVAYAATSNISNIKYSDTDHWEAGRYFREAAWNHKDKTFIKDRSPVFHVNKIKAALFMVHGKMDRRVPYRNYTEMTEALDDINYPYESMVETEEGHGFYKLENKKRLYKKMLEFFDKHIGE